MKEQLLVKAIAKLRPTSEFSFIEGDYSTIKWDRLEGNAPTVAELDSAMIEIQKAEDLINAKRVTDKAALLERLGMTADEAALLLG